MTHNSKEKPGLKKISHHDRFFKQGYSNPRFAREPFRLIFSKKEKDICIGCGVRDQNMRRFLRRRSSIEPVIERMKQEHRFETNYLGGIEGDKFNPVLSACAFNLKEYDEVFCRSLFLVG